MRRTIPLVLTIALALAACGSDSDSGSSPDDSTADSVPTESAPDGSTPDESTPDPGADKPSVEFPGGDVTELKVTVLEEGTGAEAVEGDTVVVDYVGVRSEDGVEFDNSYDRGQPFDVVLGSGSVIDGWEQGLVGARAGSRLQIDIPSDLAYGEAARDEIIGENEDLTFVIDVRAVVPPANAEDKPTEPGVDASEGATEVTTVDLVEGDGAEAQAGQTALVRYVLFRGDNGVELESNWESSALPLPLTSDAFPVLVEGIEGMKVGGRRAITFPPAYPDFGFGPDGNPTGGLPANTDSIIVVDLLGVYGEPD